MWVYYIPDYYYRGFNPFGIPGPSGTPLFPPVQPGTPNFPGGFPGTPGFPGGFPGTPNFPGQPFPPIGPGGGMTPGQPGTGGQGGAPNTPPPAMIPQKPGGQGQGAFFIDPGAISNCLFKFTYIWQSNGTSYWLFPTFIGPNSIAGFRWTGNMWVNYAVDLRFVDSSVCV